MNPNPNLTRIPKAARRGFTLIELLVAIAILGILGTVAVQALWGNIDDAAQKTTKTKVDTIYNLCMSYKRNRHSFPTDLMDLTQPDPRNRNEPYCEPTDLYDAWENPLVLKEGERPGSIVVMSYGADNRESGFDPTEGINMDIASNRPLFPIGESR